MRTYVLAVAFVAAFLSLVDYYLSSGQAHKLVPENHAAELLRLTKGG